MVEIHVFSAVRCPQIEDYRRLTKTPDHPVDGPGVGGWPWGWPVDGPGVGRPYYGVFFQDEWRLNPKLTLT